MVRVKIKKKKEDIINKYEFNIQEKSKYKCFSFYDNDPLHCQIFKELGKISKNIYNISIYSIQVFNYFKIQLYETLYNDLLEEQKNKKIINKINESEYINNKLNNYFILYSSLKDHIKNNNNYIYKFIINYITINKIIIKNSNYNKITNDLINLLNNNENIYKDNINNDLLFNQIVIKIINSIYTKNYMRMKKEMLNHQAYTINDNEIIKDIKENNILDFSTKNIYKPLINEILINKYKVEISKDPKYKYEIKSDQNYIGRLVYNNLGHNEGKINSTMIGSIIAKAYQAYTSYFALLQKGIKAKNPKFLKKDDIYNLIYTYSDTVKTKNLVNMYTSNYISKNFEQFGEEYIKIANNKYVNKKYLLPIQKEKITKNNNYIVNNKYIQKDNRHIIDSKHITLQLPKKVKKLKIKVVEIVFINNAIKICISYETLNINIEKKEIINPNESISIDLGMKNLLSIYNPTGKQNIVDGKFLSSTNNYFNYKISKAQSEKNMNLYHKLHLKRKNIINNYFNNVVKWMLKEYNNKKLIIIGYNEEWKQNANLGKTNNRNFYSIPYLSLINKIKTKFIERNMIVQTIEESYTSKCDALALEELNKHDIYLGNREKRGLFSSSTNKLINADINGAINIMRKIFTDLKKVEGINLYNPVRINIFSEVAKPANNDMV